MADEIAFYEMSQEEIGEVTKASNAGNATTTDEDEEEQGMMLMEQPEQSEFQTTEDEDYLESDYELLESPLSLLSCTMINLRVACAHQNIVNEHIIVCGIHPSIYYFILPLRAKYLHFHKPIVVLNPEPPSNEVWESINRFPNIWYIKGSPKNMEDLYRANIGYADKAIIFANTQMIGDDSDMCDSETTLIYKALKRAEPEVQVIVEIVNTNNLKYLEYDRETDEAEEQKQRGSSLKASEKSRPVEEEIELVACRQPGPALRRGRNIRLEHHRHADLPVLLQPAHRDRHPADPHRRPQVQLDHAGHQRADAAEAEQPLPDECPRRLPRTRR